MVLGIEPKASCVLGKCFTTKPHPEPQDFNMAMLLWSLRQENHKFAQRGQLSKTLFQSKVGVCTHGRALAWHVWVPGSNPQHCK